MFADFILLFSNMFSFTPLATCKRLFGIALCCAFDLITDSYREIKTEDVKIAKGLLNATSLF